MPSSTELYADGISFFVLSEVLIWNLLNVFELLSMLAALADTLTAENIISADTVAVIALITGDFIILHSHLFVYIYQILLYQKFSFL